METEKQSSTHLESPPNQIDYNGASNGSELKSGADNVKVDKHGFALSPQPSDNKDDPLVSRTCSKGHSFCSS